MYYWFIPDCNAKVRMVSEVLLVFWCEERVSRVQINGLKGRNNRGIVLDLHFNGCIVFKKIKSLFIVCKSSCSVFVVSVGASGDCAMTSNWKTS